MDLHAGIAMDVKPTIIMKPICEYCNGCKNPTSITRPICEYCNGCKKPNNYYEIYM